MIDCICKWENLLLISISFRYYLINAVYRCAFCWSKFFLSFSFFNKNEAEQKKIENSFKDGYTFLFTSFYITSSLWKWLITHITLYVLRWRPIDCILLGTFNISHWSDCAHRYAREAWIRNKRQRESERRKATGEKNVIEIILTCESFKFLCFSFCLPFFFFFLLVRFLIVACNYFVNCDILLFAECYVALLGISLGVPWKINVNEWNDERKKTMTRGYFSRFLIISQWYACLYFFVFLLNNERSNVSTRFHCDLAGIPLQSRHSIAIANACADFNRCFQTDSSNRKGIKGIGSKNLND